MLITKFSNIPTQTSENCFYIVNIAKQIQQVKRKD